MIYEPAADNTLRISERRKYEKGPLREEERWRIGIKKLKIYSGL